MAWTPRSAGRLDGHQDEAGVVDRRVGQHSLHVGLHDGHDRTDEERQDGDAVDDGLPVDPVGGEPEVEDTDQPGETRRLDARRHVGHDRRRSTLVDVGGPGVERRRRHLEPEAHQQHRHAGEEQAVVEQHGGRQVVEDLDEVRAAGGAVGEGDAVEQERRGERPEDEVLHAGFLRRGPPQVHGGEHVDGQREDLEAEEQDDEVVGGGHQDAARGRQEHQDVELGAVHAFPPQVPVGEE